MTINKLIYGCILFTVIVCAHADKHDLYEFTHPAQKAQFERLNHELRCVVCQNQTLAESQAPLAVDLRAKIYEQVRAGKNDDEILSYLKSRYGEFISYTPPVKPSTYLLWLAPLLLLLSGAVIVLVVKKKHAYIQREDQ